MACFPRAQIRTKYVRNLKVSKLYNTSAHRPRGARKPGQRVFRQRDSPCFHRIGRPFQSCRMFPFQSRCTGRFCAKVKPMMSHPPVSRFTVSPGISHPLLASHRYFAPARPAAAPTRPLAAHHRGPGTLSANRSLPAPLNLSHQQDGAQRSRTRTVRSSKRPAAEALRSTASPFGDGLL